MSLFLINRPFWVHLFFFLMAANASAARDGVAGGCQCKRRPLVLMRENKKEMCLLSAYSGICYISLMIKAGCQAELICRVCFEFSSLLLSHFPQEIRACVKLPSARPAVLHVRNSEHPGHRAKVEFIILAGHIKYWKISKSPWERRSAFYYFSLLRPHCSLLSFCP